MERNLFARKPDRVKLLVAYQWRIRGGTRWGGGVDPPLCLDQTEARKGENFLFFLSQDVDDRPPLSEGVDPPLHREG